MATEVFFATNRKVKKRNQSQQPIDFGTELNNKKPLLHFGKARVIDKDLEEVNTPKDIISEELCCSQGIFNEIQDRMFKGIDTIIFFHGFYNTFKNAIIEAAELKRLYEQEGNSEYTMIVFSWPSEGKIFAYNSDRHDARKSRKVFGSGLYKMSRFLTELCQLKNNQKIILDTCRNENNKTNCGRLHIMAHSMGNYVLRHTLQKFYKIKRNRIFQLFDEILLIAADVDEDSFEHKHKFKLLPELTKRVSVYFNQEDIPLKISDWFMGNDDRLGSEGPSQPHNIPTNVFLINCKNVVSGLLEHNYHKTEPAVYRDISYTLIGRRSKDIPGRVYRLEANSYYLKQTTKTDASSLNKLKIVPEEHAPSHTNNLSI